MPSVSLETEEALATSDPPSVSDYLEASDVKDPILYILKMASN